MKKPAFLVACFFPVLLFAQVEFAPIGATWYYEQEPWIPWWKLIYYKVEVTGIDTIQGRACKRIESRDFQGDLEAGCSYHNATFYTYEKDGRVYIYYDGSFSVLYDFNAKVGDSWAIRTPYFDWSMADSLIVQVDSISYLSVGNDTVKVQHVSHPDVSPGGLLVWGPMIIEGIGNNGFILPQWPTCDPWIYGLRCYADDSLDLHFVSYPCDSIKVLTSTQEPVLQGGLFSPNPVLDNTVSLSEAVEADRIVLSNTLGVLQKTFLLGNERVLELGDIEPGIYFAAMYKGPRLVGNDRLVIPRR